MNHLLVYLFVHLILLKLGENVEILAKHEGRIVAAREGQFLGCSFHPELTDDHRFTELFIEMVKESVEVKAG